MNTNLSNPKFVKKINLCPLCNKKKEANTTKHITLDIQTKFQKH